VSRGDPDFDGMVVGLGALGVITRVTLDVQPAYEVEQRVYEGLSWDAVEQNFEEIASIANSVSFFTHWGEIVEQVWVKRRTDEPDRVEGGAGDGRAASDRRDGSHPLHPAVGQARSLVGPHPTLPDGIHAEQRRRDPVGVPPSAPARR
jgi:xylitol oxidase